MEASPTLEVAGLFKAFGPVQVLRDVTFRVEAGQVTAIVGENGSGKSTTMNIASGVLSPDAGRMRLNGEDYAPAHRRASERAGVAFIQQELNIFPDLSVAENLFLGRAPRVTPGLPIISRRRLIAESRGWLQQVGLTADPATAARRLSAGERQLLEIARALSTRPRLIIFDEPTTSLAARETERLFVLIERLKSEGVAIIYVSHLLEDVLRLADRVLVLRDGAVTLDQPRSEVSARGLVSAMVGRDIGSLYPERPPSSASAETLLEARGVGEPGVLRGVDVTVRAGEIVGLAGLMGSGRTELARILFGLDRHRDGEVRIRGRVLRSGSVRERLKVGAAFLTEDRRLEGVLPEATVDENFELAALPRYASVGGLRLDRTALRRRAAELARGVRLKSADTARTAIRTLSGGNQQKVLLGRWMMCEPSVLIVDEPTRGVDVGARQDIYRLLAEMAAKGAGILLISSDLEEVMGLSDRLMVLSRGRIAARFERAEYDRERILAAAFGQEMAA